MKWNEIIDAIYESTMVARSARRGETLNKDRASIMTTVGSPQRIRVTTSFLLVLRLLLHRHVEQRWQRTLYVRRVMQMMLQGTCGDACGAAVYTSRLCARHDFLGLHSAPWKKCRIIHMTVELHNNSVN